MVSVATKKSTGDFKDIKSEGFQIHQELDGQATTDLVYIKNDCADFDHYGFGSSEDSG
jgi:hypothetical protein